MDTTRLTKLSTACAAFAVCAALVGPAPAHAADDETLDQQIYNGIMEGLGFKRDGAPTINYQERAPLVIPPSRDLPAPEKTDSITANNPSWPKDPDVARRKAQTAMEKDRNISDEREREQNPLRPDQLTPGGRGKINARQTRDDGYQPSASGFGNPLPPSELGSKGGFFGLFKSSKDETTKFTGEPPRALLTDPPTGYQTPSPDQPYGAGKAAAPKATNDYLTRGELSK